MAWCITERCNYRCRFCGCWRDPGDEVTESEAMQCASEMVEHGVLAVSLSGGEVLLRQDVGRIIHLLSAEGVITRVTTNGSLLPERIGDLGGVSAIKMSLDGPPEVHDDLRGEGSFDEIATAVEAARGAGIEVQLNSVLTRHLVGRIDEHLDVVARLGSRVTFQVPEQRGADRKVLEDLGPAPDEMKRVLAMLGKLAKAGDRRIGNSPGTLEYMSRWPDRDQVDCHAGRVFCRVMADGRVMACDRDYAPCETPPPGTVTGFGRVVASMRKAGWCRGCWRNNTIEINRALGGAADAIRAVRKLV